MRAALARLRVAPVWSELALALPRQKALGEVRAKDAAAVWKWPWALALAAARR